MKQILKLSVFAVVMVNLFLISSCEENVQMSCDDFSVGVDNVIIGNVVSLTANPIDGVPDYTYAWSTGSTTQSIDVTIEDTYTVTVTDGNDCTASVDVVVDASSVPCDSLFISITQSEDMGIWTLETTILNGVSPYTYIWSNGETTSSIDVSMAGWYTVTITDANGCEGDQYQNISGPCSGFGGYIFGAIDSLEMDSTFSLWALTFGGTQPYSYEWNTGETTGSIAADEGLEFVYEVTVTDANDCEFTADYEQCVFNGLSVYSSYDDALMELFLTANAFGGTQPYTYLWSNNETTKSIEIETDTEYSVTVTDFTGCMSSYDYVPCLNYYASIYSYPDSITSNIILKADAFNGTSGYQYQWTTGEVTREINVGQQTGSFTVTIVDAAGCEDEDTIEL